MKKLLVLGIILSGVFLYSQESSRENPEDWAGAKFLRFNPQIRCDRALFEQQHPFFNPAIRERELKRSRGPLFLLQADLDQAVNTAWKAVGPLGGDVRGIAINPKKKTEMTALVSSGGNSQIYVSTKSGKSWKRKSIILRSSYDIAYDPKNSQKLYVLSYSSLFVSSDGGSSWEERKFGQNINSSNGRLYIHPNNPNTIYVSGYYYYNTQQWKSCMAVMKSTDSGNSWTVQKLNTSSDYGYTYFVKMDPSDPNTLYAGGYFRKNSKSYRKLYKTSNGGNSWMDKTGSISSSPEDIAIHPNNPNKLVVVTSWGIFRSTNGGNSWQNSSGYPKGYSVVMDPSAPDIVYSGYGSGIYKSTDGGSKWTEFKQGVFGSCRHLTASAGTLYYASSAGIYSSSNKGTSWKSSHAGIKAVKISAIAIAPSSHKTMYAEGDNNGFFKSTKYGKRMNRLPYFYRCDAVLDISVFPNDAQKLYILAGG